MKQRWLIIELGEVDIKTTRINENNSTTFHKMKRKNMILLITATIMGLTAGIFFCWSVSVTVGLAPLPDKEYITAFQSLNRQIQNPWFFLCLLGTALLLPLSAWMHYHRPAQIQCWLLLAAAVIYLVFVIGITMAANVPMNNALDVFNVHTATDAEITAKRIAFEAPWNRLNNIRTVACIVCLVLTIAACMVRRDMAEMKLAGQFSSGRFMQP
jgi:uncharacterized membrane protein